MNAKLPSKQTAQPSVNLAYVNNAWYVAGWASEFAQELRRITVLEQNIVTYRATDGQVVALRDQCPHRLLPLSKGKLIDNAIQCGYHGLTFAANGQCTRVPGQTTIPANACVRAYPVHQVHDIVWIWMGDPALADPANIFSLPQFNDQTWCAHQGDALHIESNYLNVAENLVDPAHVSFVHPTTLGNSSSEDVPVSFDINGKVIQAWRWIRNAPPVGFFEKFGGFKGNVDRWHYYDLHLPCTAVIDFGSADVGAQLSPENRDKGVRIFALHFLTPVNPTYTIDRWMHLRNTATDDSAVSEQLDGLFRVAFAEDKAILESIQQEELLPATRQAPVRFEIDRGPTAYRSRIDRLIESE